MKSGKERKDIIRDTWASIMAEYLTLTLKKQPPSSNMHGGCYVFIVCDKLLYLVYDSLESLWVVHSEVSENLTVDLDTCLVKSTHQL